MQFSVGAEAADYQKVANAEKLNPLETELRKLETVVKEIVDEMNYLKAREARLRDTNGLCEVHLILESSHYHHIFYRFYSER